MVAVEEAGKTGVPTGFHLSTGFQAAALLVMAVLAAAVLEGKT
jgi:hypothetical protein